MIVVCVQVVWLKGLEQVQAVVDLLAAGLLAGLESRGEEPDAAFRAAFRYKTTQKRRFWTRVHLALVPPDVETK